MERCASAGMRAGALALCVVLQQLAAPDRGTAGPSLLLGIGSPEGVLVSVVDHDGQPVPRADVEMRLVLPDDAPINARGLADAEGQVRLRLLRAP